MKIFYSALSSIIFLFIIGCTAVQGEDQKIEQIVLLDVQGLWGGRNLWISGDGNAFFTFVTPPKEGESGLQESRYKFMLSGIQKASLLDSIKKYDFFSIKVKERPGVPDEAHPYIFVKSGTQSKAVWKWANDTHNDFDPIYDLLLNIAESAKKGLLIYHGAFDWNWKPDSFPDSKYINRMTGK